MSLWLQKLLSALFLIAVGVVMLNGVWKEIILQATYCIGIDCKIASVILSVCGGGFSLLMIGLGMFFGARSIRRFTRR